jgi:hypothetical protein
LYESIQRKTAAVLKAKGGPTPQRNVYSICSVSIMLSNPLHSEIRVAFHHSTYENYIHAYNPPSYQIQNSIFWDIKP